MKRHGLLVVAVGLALAAVVFSALAQDRPEPGRRPGGRRPGMGRGPMMFGRRPGMLPDFTSRLPDLTEEQRKQIAEVRRAAMEKVRKIQEKMNQDVKKLLTPEQVKAMEQAERRSTHRGPDGVIMTDAQKKILDDAQARGAKADGREARMEIMREAIQKVRASYTDEQKKQAEETRRRFQGRPGGEGSRRGGREGGGREDRGDRTERPRRPATE